jgi:hypothetical protein
VIISVAPRIARVVEGVLRHRWAECDGTYAELLERRSQSLNTLPNCREHGHRPPPEIRDPDGPLELPECFRWPDVRRTAHCDPEFHPQAGPGFRAEQNTRW